ncbi:hypothetical protein [Pseudomonas cavernicola]|nr:hypothetical protein [Pseudomonas cavernicola]
MQHIGSGKHMIRLIVLTTLLTIGGCATVNKTTTKDGGEALSIDCSGQALKWQHCYEKATQVCAGSGYETIGKKGRPDTDPADRLLGVEPGKFANRNLVVICK